MLKIPFYSEGEFEGPNGRTWEICQKQFLWARKRLEIHKQKSLSHGYKICGLTKNRTRKYFESHFLAWIPPKLKISIKFQSQPPTGTRVHLNFSNIFRSLFHASKVFKKKFCTCDRPCFGPQPMPKLANPQIWFLGIFSLKIGNEFG